MSYAQIGVLRGPVYEGNESLVYPDKDEVYLTDTLEKDEKEVVEGKNISMFYKVARILSGVIALGFVGLLVVSSATGGPIHWAVALIGCLGGIGLSGAIWLSKA